METKQINDDMIDKKDFDRLKQLDRIEFLLRTKRIEEKAKYGSIAIMDYIIDGYLFLTIFLLLWKTAGLHSLWSILNLFRLFFLLMIGLFILELVYGIFLLVRYKKEKEELFNKFFKVEVKK